MKIVIKNNADMARVLTSISMLAPELGKKSYDVEIKQHHEKRSLNANAYSWLLQGKIAEATGRGVDEIHTQLIFDYGVWAVYSLLKEAVDVAVRNFDYYRIEGESTLNGKTFVHIKAGVGTHLYDTAEMARFIDGCVQEAQNLGIDTRTPQEIEEMKSLWQTQF